MNKLQLVKRIAFDAELTQAQANAAVDALMSIIMESVVAGEKVQLTGFGTFERKERKARTGRNPTTGETVPIPEGVVPFFRPGTEFREKLQ